MTEVVRQRFATTNYFVTALQIKRTRIVREDLRVANNYRDTALSDFIFSNRFKNNLGTNSGGISHRDSDSRVRVAETLNRRIFQRVVHRFIALPIDPANRLRLNA